MNNTGPRIFPIDELLSRVQGYFDEVKYKASNHEDFGPMFNFRSLALVAEIYEFVRLYFHRRKERLSDYNGMSLKKCLQVVIEIEGIQKLLGDLYYDLCRIKENNPQDSTIAFSGDGYDCRSESEMQFQKLYSEGIASLSNHVCGCDVPTSVDTLIWSAERDCANKKYQYATRFHDAHEKLEEEKPPIGLSEDPIDTPYNNTMGRKNSIGNHIAYKAEVGHKDTDGFDVLKYVLDSYHRADGITTDDICAELKKSLEMLRIAFMTDAEDILRIRTGNFAQLEKRYDKEEIHELYSVLPFVHYKESRSQYEADYIETNFRWKQEEWRTLKAYVGGKLSVQQRLEFLSDTRNEVIQQMQDNPELWTIRMHSGGLDSDVTSENFAMMFYRRGDTKQDNLVLQSFVELQWQYEILSEKIALLEIEQQRESATSKVDIVEKTVQDFVANISLLSEQLYEKWNNKTISLGAHKADATIIIKLGELDQYLDEKRKSDYEELKEICYPKDSTYNRRFCQYVAYLKAQGYFGLLPDKIIAQSLAPIIGIGEGTAANYLAEK